MRTRLFNEFFFDVVVCISDHLQWSRNNVERRKIERKRRKKDVKQKIILYVCGRFVCMKPFGGFIRMTVGWCSWLAEPSQARPIYRKDSLAHLNPWECVNRLKLFMFLVLWVRLLWQRVLYVWILFQFPFIAIAYNFVLLFFSLLRLRKTILQPFTSNGPASWHFFSIFFSFFNL